MVLWWVAGEAVLYWSQAISVEGLYETQDEFDRAAASMAENSAFIAMAGPPRALNTVGGQVAWQAAAFGAVLAGLMSMFLVVRHTRAEEESGRDELLRSLPIGRVAPLAATANVVLAANLLLGSGIALALIAYGLEPPGSIALGLAACLAGLVFAGVTAVAAQLTGGARSTYAITGAVLGVAYALRAVGDVAGNGVSWASPIGWGQYMRPFAGETWWPALISVAAVLALATTARVLFEHRDVGAGMWPSRPGPARGSVLLASPEGFSWRLQRGAVAGWSLGLLLGGAAFGSIGDDVGELVGDGALAEDMFGLDRADLVDSFYATSAAMLALIAGGFAISSIARLRAEETSGHSELLLATSVSRERWATAHLLTTLIGTLAIVALAGVGMGSGYALTTGDAAAIGNLTAATVPHAAAVLVLAAVAWLGYAVRPRFVVAGWVALTWAAVELLFAETFRMPTALRRTSPFAWPAATPAEHLRLAPVLALLAVTLLIVWAGMAAFKRRDLG
jgi:ABC-2 type transport system permease protein